MGAERVWLFVSTEYLAHLKMKNVISLSLLSQPRKYQPTLLLFLSTHLLRKMLVIALLLLLATGLAQDLYELDSIYRRHPLYRDYYALDSTGDIAPGIPHPCEPFPTANLSIGFTQSPNLKHVPRFDIFEDSTTDVLIPRSIEKRKQYLDHRELLTVVEKMLRRTLEHGPTHVLCHSYNWRNFDDHRVTDMTDYRNKYLVTKEYGRHYALIVSEVDSEGFHGTVLELAVDWQQPGSVGPERGKHKNLFNHPEPFQDTSATRGSVLEYVGTTTKTDDELIKAGESLQDTI